MSNAIRSTLFAVVTLVVSLGQMGAHAAPGDQPTLATKPFRATPLTANAKEMVTVRLLSYSGRPDPEYVIPANQIPPFIKKAKRLKYKGKSIIPSILGYRGVLVTNPAKAGALPEMFAVYDGKIEVTGTQKSYFVDESRALEKFLMKEAVKRKAIGDEVFKRIRIDEGSNGKDGQGKTPRE